MSERQSPDAPITRTATCACGALRATTTGEPLRVYACSCLDCQKGSGSVFTYTAWFAASAVRLEGEYRSWRRGSEFGRWNESSFCPVCGTSLVTRGEGCPGEIGIAVGCFVDASFQRPAWLFWSSRRHHWLDLPAGIDRVDRQ